MESKEEIIQLGGPHLKTCPWCEVQFYGRSNQKFCSISHKGAMNRVKSEKTTQKFNTWFKEMKIAHKALSSSFAQRNEDGWVKAGIAAGKGFDPDVATKLGTSKNGDQFKMLFDYAFRLSDDRQFIQIIKLKK